MWVFINLLYECLLRMYEKFPLAEVTRTYVRVNPYFRIHLVGDSVLCAINWAEEWKNKIILKYSKEFPHLTHYYVESYNVLSVGRISQQDLMMVSSKLESVSIVRKHSTNE